MATVEQVAFLRQHITEVEDQTNYARSTAVSVEHQITADRLLRAMAAVRMLVDLVVIDGDQSTMSTQPVWPAIAEILGFETF